MAGVPHEFDIDHPGSTTHGSSVPNCPVGVQYSLYGYGRVLSLVWIFDASVFLSLVPVLCLATELSAEVPPTADTIAERA